MEQLLPGDPKRVGEYRLLSRLGEGGMGQVFLARSRSGRKVALKLLKRELADNPEFRTRFAREVAAARQVSGLHTAQVIDADPDANPPWLATVYIEGDSLQRAIRRGGPLESTALRHLGAGLAEGLAAIHAAGVVHRDLKPANVIMAYDGPRIIDFGISRALDSSTLTQAGMVLGTFAFMAPEQIRADSADAAADVFALGCLLAYAATGASPFEATTLPAVTHRVLTVEPDLDGVPEEQRQLVAACLAKEPTERPSVAEVSARLALDEPRPTVVDPGREDDEAGTTGPVGATAVEPTRHWPSGATVAAPTGAPDPEASAPVRKRIPRRTVLFGGIGAAVAVAAPTVALWAMAESEVGGEVGRLYLDDEENMSSGEVLSAVFSPDGKTVAGIVHSSGQHIQLWDVDSRKRTRQLSGGDVDAAIAFSPDGAQLATGGDTVRLWNVESGLEVTSSEFGGRAVSLAFSPDGNSLAVGTDKGLAVWEVVTGDERVVHYEPTNAVAFSPDGKLLASLGEADSGVWDVATDERIPELANRDGVGSLAFSPDGGRLVVGLGAAADGKDAEFGPTGLWVWDVSGRSVSGLGDRRLRRIAFHPDGKRIAISGESRIKLCDAETGDSDLTFDNDESRSLSFSPDGTLLATVEVHSRECVTLYRV